MSAASPSFSGPYSADHEPTARIVRPGDGCFAVVEVDVTGTVDEVWESVATGPGYRRWFGEAELEERPGQGPDDGPAHTRVRLTSGVETEGERWVQDIEGTLPAWSAALLLLGEHHAPVPGPPDDEALGWN